MLSLDNKLFVQLAPGEKARHDFVALSDSLVCEHTVSADSLHLTVVHIGKLQRLFDAIKKQSDISERDFLTASEHLANHLETIRQNAPNSLSLESSKLENFGPHGSVLVLRFLSSPELDQLHQKSLDCVRDFLRQLSIKNPDAFIKTNDSLQHSLELRPHVSLAKQSPKFSRSITTTHYEFSVMPIVYTH